MSHPAFSPQYPFDRPPPLHSASACPCHFSSEQQQEHLNTLGPEPAPILILHRTARVLCRKPRLTLELPRGSQGPQGKKKQALYLSIQGFSSLPPNSLCSSSFYCSFQRRSDQSFRHLCPLPVSAFPWLNCPRKSPQATRTSLTMTATNLGPCFPTRLEAFQGQLCLIPSPPCKVQGVPFPPRHVSDPQPTITESKNS